MACARCAIWGSGEVGGKVMYSADNSSTTTTTPLFSLSLLLVKSLTWELAPLDGDAVCGEALCEELRLGGLA